MHPLTRGGGAVPSAALLARTYGDCFVNATWIDAGPHGMKDASERSRIRTSERWTWGAQAGDRVSGGGIKREEECATYIRRVHLVALDDVHDTDVAI